MMATELTAHVSEWQLIKVPTIIRAFIITRIDEMITKQRDNLLEIIKIHQPLNTYFYVLLVTNTIEATRQVNVIENI